MTQDFEYNDAMRAMCELLWGEGYMAPGGDGNVANLIRGLDLRDKRILDIGSGLGGPAFFLAKTCGAFVVGIDIEPRQIELSKSRAKELGLDAQTEFLVVEPGPLKFSAHGPPHCLEPAGLSRCARCSPKPPGIRQSCRLLGW